MPNSISKIKFWPRFLQAISIRMIGVFMLLVLAAMLTTGTYLWISLERFYLQQNTQAMLSHIYSFEVSARNYLQYSQELQNLQELLTQAGDQDEVLYYQEEIKRLVDARSFDYNNLYHVLISSATDSIPMGDVEASDVYRVAILHNDLRVDEPSLKSPGELELGSIDLSFLSEAMISGNYRTQRFNRSAGKSLMVLAYPILNNLDNSGLGLIYLETEVVSLDANLAAVREILAMATIGALILTSLASAFLARGITAPITQLTVRAQAIAAGDYDSILEVRSQDEVGRLAESFNTMSQRLKETMDEIADEKGKMEAMLGYMAEGIIAVDQDGLIIHINPSARRMFSLQDEGIGVPLVEILGALEQELGWRRSILRDEMVTCELSLEQDNQPLSLRAHSAPFFTAGEEKPAGVVVVLTDISEEERLEETRRDFIANVSHELRTPLTTIRSYVETLLEGALHTPELANRFLNVVLQESDRMGRLVSELLQIAQLDAPVRPENYLIQDLRYILASVERKMMPQFQAKQQTFKLDLCLEAAMILAPLDRIEQCCVNLLSNACKYTPEGGEITMILQSYPVGSEIIVQDNGVGIAAEHLPRLFERFYRIDKARSREQGGTGLGLAIVKQIVEKLGGSITVQSQVGRGTRFAIWLPKPEQFAVRSGEHHV